MVVRAHWKVEVIVATRAAPCIHAVTARARAEGVVLWRLHVMTAMLIRSVAISLCGVQSRVGRGMAAVSARRWV